MKTTSATNIKNHKHLIRLVINQIEDTTGLGMFEIDAQLDDQAWEAIYANKLPGLKKAYKKLSELHEQLTA